MATYFEPVIMCNMYLNHLVVWSIRLYNYTILLIYWFALTASISAILWRVHNFVIHTMQTHHKYKICIAQSSEGFVPISATSAASCFFRIYSVSSINKTDRHHITQILLKQFPNRLKFHSPIKILRNSGRMIPLSHTYITAHFPSFVKWQG